LAALYPGRIELGLGRAPGTDPITMRALRRNLAGAVDEFPKDVVELMRYFEPADPGQGVQAVPGAGLDVPVRLLGSSLFGARPPFRLRLALRPRGPAGGGRPLPRPLPTLEAARQTLRHARDEPLRR